MRPNSKIKPIVAAMMLFPMAGCSTMQTYHEAQSGFASAKQQVNEKNENLAATREAQINHSYQPKVEPIAYVNTNEIPTQQNLPASFDDHCEINLPYPTTIGLVMGKLKKITGINMSYENDIVDHGSRASGSVGDGSGSDGGQAPTSTDATGRSSAPGGAPQILNLTGLSASGGDKAKEMKITVSSQGSVKDILDATASAMNASWKYDADSNTVQFYRYMTKTFQLSVLPGDSNNDVDMSNGEGSLTGGAKQKIDYKSKLSIWKSIKNSLNTMLSSKGAFTVSESTGTVTIRDVPDVVARVDHYIKNLNKTFSRQVSIKVTVYRVEDNKGDTRGINWNGVFNSPRFSFALNTQQLQPNNISSAASSLASTIIGIPEGAGSHSPWQGSQLLLDSLSSIGKVSVVTSTDVSTVNNEAAPVRVIKKVSYLKSLTNTQTSNVGSSVSLSPGEVETGFSMQVLPHVSPNGRDMLMQVMVSLSTLDTIQTFSSGGSTIQLPQVSSRDFVQRAWLKSGQSLVLAGFQSTESNDTANGMVDASVWPLGGTKSVAHNKESIVIVITPVVSSSQDGI